MSMISRIKADYKVIQIVSAMKEFIILMMNRGVLICFVSRLFFAPVDLTLFPRVYTRVACDSRWHAFSATRARKSAMRIIKVCPAVHGLWFVGRSHDLPLTLTTSALADLVHPRAFATNSPFSLFLSR